MIFSNLELVHEDPQIICGKFPLRLYRSKENNEERFRWHFGFPKELVEPIYLLLQTTLYWADPYWKEDGEFWLWSILSTDTPDIPFKELQKDLIHKLKSYNNCLETYKKMVNNKKRE